MLLVIQSIIVYGLIIWVMTYWGQVAYKSQYPKGFGVIDRLTNKSVSPWEIFTKPYFIIPIFIFCLFASVRYKVGVDCNSYKKIFYEILQYGESISAPNIETGFKSLVNITSVFTDSHYLLFFILALLQIGLLYISLRKERVVFVFWGTALILTGHYWSLMNGIRQNIAACAFVAMIPFLLKTKKWPYFIMGTFLAMTMHKSALILLPIGVIAYFSKNIMLNKYLQLVILFVCFLLMNKFNNILGSGILEFASEAGYDDSQIDSYTNLEETNYKFGLRMILQYLVYCLTIYFSKNMYHMFNSQFFNVTYNLFFIGICLQLVFYNNFTIFRVLFYLICFIPIVVSYFMFYLWKNKMSVWQYIVLIMLVIQVIWSIYSDVSFKGINETMLYKFDL